MKTISKPATWAIRIAGYSFFLVLGYFAAAVASDIYLRDKATTFCRAIVEGDAASTLVKSALDAGATLPEPAWSVTPGASESLVVKFPGLAPLNGYACTLVARKGMVRSKTFSELGDLVAVGG